MQHRRMVTFAVVVALSAVTLVGAPSAAAPGDCRVIRPATEVTAEVSACREDVWLHRAVTPIGNLAGTGQVALPSWDTTAPTGSMDTGDSAVYVGYRHIDIASPRNPAGRPTFQGTYTGVLDNFAVKLFISSPAYQAVSIPTVNYHRLVIDGTVIFEVNAASDPEIELPITPVGDHVGYISYAFTDLYAALEAADLPNDPDTVHSIEFSTINKYHGDGNFVVHFDAGDVPSGVVINAEPNSKGRLPAYVEIDTN